MQQACALDILTPQPIEFGICNGGESSYYLSSWLDGEHMGALWPDMSGTEQYTLGLKSGDSLFKIHTLPAPIDAEPWKENVDV